MIEFVCFFFFSSRRRHTRSLRDWSSDVCSSDLDLADELPYMQPNTSVQILSVNGKPSSLQLPASVELAVVETEPGVKGDTVSNVTKPATLETGAVVQVPLFVNVGDRLKDR